MAHQVDQTFAIGDSILLPCATRMLAASPIHYGIGRMSKMEALPRTITRTLACKEGDHIPSPWRIPVPQAAAAAAFLSHVGGALALTYDVKAPDITLEDLQEATETVAPTVVPTSPSLPASDFLSLSDNPALIAAVVAFLLVGIGLAVASGQGGFKPTVRGVSPQAALELLKEDSKVIFVDIRSKASIKKSGNPSLVGSKGKLRQLSFTEEKGEDTIETTAFGEKFGKMSGLQDESVVVLFDSEGEYSPKAAEEILKVLEFKSVLYISGGETAWRKAELGWKEPPKPIELPSVTVPKLSLPKVDLGGAAQGVTGALKNVSGAAQGVAGGVGTVDGSALGPGLLLGAFAATSFVIINELDFILEIVGLLGVINIVGRKFLFAESRAEFVDQIRSLIKDEIAPQEAGDDLKRLATAVLSFPKESKTTGSS